MKRSFDEDTVEEQGADKKVKSGVDFRFVIEKRQQGMLIGKGGKKIQSVREESGVVASILKVTSAQDPPERVLLLQGSVAQCATACKMFADTISEFQVGDEKSDLGESVTMKVLCDKTQIGCIIGKGGAAIRQSQADSGARIQISNEPMPGSSEKTITVSGNPAVLEQALLIVLDQLSSYPLRPGTVTRQFVPGQSSAPPAFQQQPPYNPYGAPPSDPYGAPPQAPYGYQGQQQSYQSRAPPPPASGSHTQKIVIPSMCAGGVIGKGGSRIKDMQMQSGCRIKIADATADATNERIVTVEGTDEGIQIAIQLIRHCVEASAARPQQE